MKTIPAATTGESTKLPPVLPVHARSSRGTVCGERTFSKALQPRCSGDHVNCAQFERTTNAFCAERPLRRPAAVIQCTPGTAEDRIVTVMPVNEPAAFAFALASATSVASTYTSTSSKASKPLPETRTADVG